MVRALDKNKIPLAVIGKLRSDDDTANAALEVCKSFASHRSGEQEMRNVVMKLMTEEPTGVTVRAVGYLCMPEQDVLDKLIELIDHSNSAVRVAALESLGDFHMMLIILHQQEMMQRGQPPQSGQIIVPTPAMPPSGLFPR